MTDIPSKELVIDVNSQWHLSISLHLRLQVPAQRWKWTMDVRHMCQCQLTARRKSDFLLSSFLPFYSNIPFHTPRPGQAWGRLFSNNSCYNTSHPTYSSYMAIFAPQSWNGDVLVPPLKPMAGSFWPPRPIDAGKWCNLTLRLALKRWCSFSLVLLESLLSEPSHHDVKKLEEPHKGATWRFLAHSASQGPSQQPAPLHVGEGTFGWFQTPALRLPPPFKFSKQML